MDAERTAQPASRSAPGTESLSCSDGTELLSVTVQQPEDAVLVSHVTGELDMLTGPLLQDHLSKLLANRPERLIIDLSQVSFLGSTGLTVLLSVRQAAAQQNTRLQLAGTARRTVAMPLRITGLNHLFEIVSD